MENYTFYNSIQNHKEKPLSVVFCIDSFCTFDTTANIFMEIVQLWF